MNTRSLLVALPLLVLIAATAGSSVALADVYSYNGNNYAIPTGYQPYQGGIFYNPNTGMYLNPVTGQTATTPLPGIATGTYVVPQGYVQYNADTYYNSSSGTYFNRLTGQTSMYSPNNPATYNPDGTLRVASGYVSIGYGIYYNGNTNTYWDSTTGLYSSALPNRPLQYYPYTNTQQQVYAQVLPAFQAAQQIAQPAQTYNVTVVTNNPALPKTGAGGSAPITIAILVASAVVVFGGVRFALKRARA